MDYLKNWKKLISSWSPLLTRTVESVSHSIGLSRQILLSSHPSAVLKNWARITRKAMKKELLFELIIYFLCVALAGFLWHKPIILTVCYAVITIITLIKWHTKSDLFFYFVAFVLGPLGESIGIYFGAWQYSKPFYLIPIWLPLLWGIAALFIKNISENLLRRRDVR